VNLSIKFKTRNWTKILKSSLTNIRKEGKNFLANIGNNDVFITVDDLDLGVESHREYMRQLIDERSLHDSRFEEYSLEKVKVIASWLKQSSESLKSTNNTLMKSAISSNYKVFDRMAELQMAEFRK
jgi:hypothetical protein